MPSVESILLLALGVIVVGLLVEYVNEVSAYVDARLQFLLNG